MDKRFSDNIRIFYDVGKLQSIILSEYAKDLVQSDIDLLNVLYYQRIKSMKDILIHTGFSPSLVTKLTKRLHNRGYLVIDISNEDKRIKTIQITDKGKMIVKIITRELKIFFEKSFTNFTNEEIDLFLKIANACHDEFKKMRSINKEI